MPISIHLPAELLRKVDQRARRQGLSRSGYIARALEREGSPESGWSAGFINQLREADDGVRDEAAALLVAVGHRRSRKKPPLL